MSKSCTAICFMNDDELSCTKTIVDSQIFHTTSREAHETINMPSA